jgi:HK97 family phage major capsid protein
VTRTFDLIEANKEAAGLSAEIAYKVANASNLTGAKAASAAEELRELNDRMEALIDRRDGLKSLVEVERLRREAVKAGQRQVNRQVEPEIEGSYSSYDNEPGVVRALKSSERFADRFGSTSVSLDQFLRAALTGNWSRIPSSLKAQSEGSDLLGGYTVPSPLANRVIDLSRAASRVIQAGAVTVPMEESTLRFARLLQDPTAAWKTENDLITASDATFEPVTLHARTLAARVVMSVELSDDSPTVGNAIETALSAALAGELDRAAIFGSGTPPEPQGLVGTSGVTELDITAGWPDVRYQDFSRAVQMIRMANHEPTGVIYGPDVAGSLERLEDEDRQPLRPPASFDGLQKFTTSKLAETAAIGDWSQFAVGMRQELRIEASQAANDENGLGFSSYSVLIRGTLRADFAVLKPAAFVILTNITPSGS